MRKSAPKKTVPELNVIESMNFPRISPIPSLVAKVALPNTYQNIFGQMMKNRPKRTSIARKGLPALNNSFTVNFLAFTSGLSSPYKRYAKTREKVGSAVPLDSALKLNTSAPIYSVGAATPEMVYDVQSDRMILINDDSLTWAFDSAANQWANMNPPTAPTVHHFAMVYADAVERVVLYGGRGGGAPDETWSYRLDDGGGGTDPFPPDPPTGLSVD